MHQQIERGKCRPVEELQDRRQQLIALHSEWQTKFLRPLYPSETGGHAEHFIWPLTYTTVHSLDGITESI